MLEAGRRPRQLYPSILVFPSFYETASIEAAKRKKEYRDASTRQVL
jgi:hypothetical protein